MTCAKWFGYLTLAAAAMLPACEAAPPEPPADNASPANKAPGAIADQPHQASAKETARIIDKTIRWPAAAERDEDARAQLNEKSRRMVDEAPLPVLVVARDEWLPQAIVTRGKHFAAVSSRHDGLIVSLHGTARAHHYAHIKPAIGPDKVRGYAAFITQNEGIWSAAWLEGGVAYSLEMECAQLPDVRCEDAEQLQRFSETLGFVGGREGARR